MSQPANTVRVTIMGKEYQVSCPADEVEALTRAAKFLDGQMEAIRASGKVVGLDRVAVMAALNITNDYLSGQSVLNETKDAVGQRLANLNTKVEAALANHKQLDL
ncbi:MAG: cell division protein ZapA [bacterium]